MVLMIGTDDGGTMSFHSRADEELYVAPNLLTRSAGYPGARLTNTDNSCGSSLRLCVTTLDKEYWLRLTRKPH